MVKASKNQTHVVPKVSCKGQSVYKLSYELSFKVPWDFYCLQ